MLCTSGTGLHSPMTEGPQHGNLQRSVLFLCRHKRFSISTFNIARGPRRLELLFAGVDSLLAVAKSPSFTFSLCSLA